ncbi:MAG: hypothetical protein JXR12_05610 [Neptunomonas phycophila]|uniref:hypothetical protein n=1 Tax=Neptunomonas phycophila TaxID=1572645 RepID=UPI003B8C1364
MNAWEITYHPRLLRVQPVTNDSSEQRRREHNYTPNITIPIKDTIDEIISEPSSRVGTIIDIYV